MFDYALNVGMGTNATGGLNDFNGHPLRVMLYIHLFSHGLAEELTTEHLVQENAVFSQVFALKYDALTDYLTGVYNRFTYASDEDFKERQKVNELIKGTPDYTSKKAAPPVHNQLEWELEYYDIFKSYSQEILTAVYQGSDENVKNDQALQKYYQALVGIFHELPARYEKFQTLKGLVTFAADSINHLVIRHQFYGTTAIASAMDPRLGSTQTCKDGGPPAVDEWRSLAYVALATAYANFVHLLHEPTDYPNADPNAPPPLLNVFDDATPVPLVSAGGDKALSQPKLVNTMKEAWESMQTKLSNLQTKWTDGGSLNDTDLEPDQYNYRQDVNYMYFRPLPRDIHTGPGY